MLCRITVALAALLASAIALAAVTTTVVDLPTRGVNQRILYVRPDAPIATIVGLPGGDGVLDIQNDGSMPSQGGKCFPIGRARQALADHGYAVALVDATSDGSTYRLADVSTVIDYVRGQASVPVWLIGGSASAPYTASIVTQLPPSLPLGTGFFSPDIVPTATAAAVSRPALVLFNPQDTGQHAHELYADLTGAPAKQLVSIAGGTNGNCGYHLFQGREAEFAAAVEAFIDQYNGSLGSSPATATAIEYYNATLDHFFLTHFAAEIATLDAGVTIKGWTRTGQSFQVYAAAGAGTSPVCRFYIPPAFGDSHFYGRGTAECTATALAHPAFTNEDPQFFHVVLPMQGQCPAGTRNVYRVFSNRADANHRYMVDAAIRDQMASRGWLPEGDGPDLVVMCAPV